MTSKKSSRNNLIYFIALSSIALLSYTYFLKTERVYEGITTFEACVSAGYPVLEKYPEECRVPGRSFVNTSQKKEPVLDADNKASSTLNYLGLKYIISGTSVSIGTSSKEQFVGTGVSNIVDMNGDNLKDILFIAERRTGNTPLYYLMLALGLHNGQTVGANGLLIGSSSPTVITVKEGGQVELSGCLSDATCRRVFKVEGGILRQ